MYWFAFSSLVSLYCLWNSRYFFIYTCWICGFGILSIISINRFYSLVRRCFSLLISFEVIWSDEYDFIRLIICCLRYLLMFSSSIISLILQSGVTCPFLPHLKHFYIFFFSILLIFYNFVFLIIRVFFTWFSLPMFWSIVFFLFDRRWKNVLIPILGIERS